jgi:hypothetical protein
MRYIWQKLALEDKYEHYQGEYSPRSKEIIALWFNSSGFSSSPGFRLFAFTLVL